MNHFFSVFLFCLPFCHAIHSQNSENYTSDSIGNNADFFVEDTSKPPAFYLTQSYFKKRYQEEHLLKKIIDNNGNGFDSLYGTRNMRPILHGVAYRGGANNYFHKTQKRKNNNPLPKDGILNLCKEGFSSSVYLYKSNWDSSSTKETCNCINNTVNNFKYHQLNYFDSSDVETMIALVHQSALDSTIGPVYLHCWNGWHASGFISAILLKQFCGYSNLDAVNYWDLCTDGTNISPRYNSIRERIKTFDPIQKYTINDSLGNAICPPMPEFIDSSQLHISLEHLKLVPEALPNGTILILDNLRFKPNSTAIPSPKNNKDLILLSEILIDNTNLFLEISGHTDKSGNEQKNIQLSKQRAHFVYDFLIKSGITSDQLSYVGLGSLFPAYSNSTKQGRAANRRIEIKLIKKDKDDYSTLVKETSLNFSEKLNQLVPNESIVIEQVQFNPNEYQLQESSLNQLNNIVTFLHSTNCIVEIVGHTDASGIEEKNINLSQLRALAAYNFLVEKGIEKSRLFYSGCGSAYPIAPNKYEWGREKNRRLEILLLNK